MRYAIADIHGCCRTLEALIQTLAPSTDDTLYILGDMVDRGRRSKEVLDLVMSMPNTVCLMGNHEELLLAAHDSPNDDEASLRWVGNGGHETLRSFGGMVPDRYLEFIRAMPLITELPDFYLCHAGIGPVPMETPAETLLWNRSCHVDLKLTGGRKLVVGHTPETLGVVLASTRQNKILIDNGCFIKDDKSYGNLIALCLDDLRITIQANID